MMSRSDSGRILLFVRVWRCSDDDTLDLGCQDRLVDALCFVHEVPDVREEDAWMDFLVYGHAVY